MSDETRKIVVDGVTYGWRVTHQHPMPPVDDAERNCVEQFTAFREGTTGAQLRIRFAADESAGPGYIHQHGVVHFYTKKMIVNLHRPRVAAALIHAAVGLGWNFRALKVDDGFGFVSALPPDVLSNIVEARDQEIGASQ